MAISDDDFLTWLRNERQQCFLINAQSYNMKTSAVVEHLWSNTPYITKPTDSPANTIYDDVIKTIPGMRVQLSDKLSGRAQVSIGNIELDNCDNSLDYLSEHAWEGRVLTVYVGSPSWGVSDFRPVLTGVVEEIQCNADDVILRVRDKLLMAEQQMLKTEVTGSGNTAGQMVPICYGTVYNVEPLLIDSATRTYQVNDGPILGIDAVRVNGETLATGNYTVNISTGKFTTTYSVTGQLTCDVRGSLTTTTAIFSDVIQRAGLSSSDVDAAALSALASAAPGVVGIYVSDDSTTVGDVLDQLMEGIGAFYRQTRAGLIGVGRVNTPLAGAVTGELTDDDVFDVSVTRRVPPMKSVRLGWGRNWAPLSNVSANVTDAGTRARLAKPYRVVRAATATNVSAFPLATASDVMPSLFWASADATTEVTRRAALWGVLRRIVSVRVGAVALAMEIGQVVNVAAGRFGLVGVPALIIGIDDSGDFDYEIEVLL